MNITRKEMITIIAIVIVYVLYAFASVQMCFYKLNKIEKRIDSIEETYNGTCYGDEDCRELNRLFEEANNQN